MSPEIALYLISVAIKLDNILDLLTVSVLLGYGILMFIKVICVCQSYNEKEESKIILDIKSYSKLFLKIFIPLVMLIILLPCEKTIYAIAGTHYLNKSEIPAKVMTILNNKLDEFIAKQTKKDDKKNNE